MTWPAAARITGWALATAQDVPAQASSGCEADLPPLLGGVPEGGDDDELVAVPLGGLAEPPVIGAMRRWIPGGLTAPLRWRGPVALRLHRRAGAAVAGVAGVGEPVAAVTTTDALRGTQKLFIVVIRDAPPP